MATDTKKQQYWQRHAARWQASGLSRRAYCAREGLAVSTFDHWRRQTRHMNAGKPGQPPIAPATRPLTLIPVQIKQNETCGELHLRSPGGWHLTLPASWSPDTLAHLLARLP